MDWIESMTDAIDYIEKNITEDLTVNTIAENYFISPFYFQKAFSMLCGYSVSEYIRFRRLSIAGRELISTDNKVIDVAIKYGYDSPDSFTKAFTRFHGVTPTAVRKDGATIKSFAPLKIKFTLEGGYIMDYKIVKKDAFKVIGKTKNFTYEGAQAEIPLFWDEFFRNNSEAKLYGMYGICHDSGMVNKDFDYSIADDYIDGMVVPKGYEVETIPEHTWAIFPSLGNTQKSIPETNRKIFSEWLPMNKEYEIAEGYNIEMYSDASRFPKGIADDNYYCEIWIPVKKK